MGMKLYYVKSKGFTVLEFLIVLGIILLLIAIILPSLGRSRDKSFDDKKVTDLKTVALGIEQYKQICGVYPAQIGPLVNCSQLGTNTLSSFIPDIASYKFNDGASGYYYTPLAFDRTHSDECDGFHLGAELKSDVSGGLEVGDSNVNTNQDQICQASDVNGGIIQGQSNSKMFDIYH